jgi:hypothetical protein
MNIKFEYMSYQVAYSERREIFTIDLVEKEVTRNTMQEVVVCINNWDKKRDEIKKGKRKNIEPRKVFRQKYNNDFEEIWVTSKDLNKKYPAYWIKDKEGIREKIYESNIFVCCEENIKLQEKKKALQEEASQIVFIKPDLREFENDE